MIKETGTVKIGVYLSRETWDKAVSALQRPEREIAEDIAMQLASPSSWISGAERPASCLTDRELARFVARIAKSRERLRYLKHLKNCDECRGAVADYQKLQRDVFPSAGEEVTEDPEDIKLQLCIAEGALKDIRKSIEAILPDHNGIRTATDAVQRLIREYLAKVEIAAWESP